ncbi:BH3 interacting domain death agonist [Trichomycterus rosablanca]|uniref:BH3 interacting domain death agonist n=1 Tax=Trichomycterus rosablanca TaxID=2290929 RepID=UPI002F35755F
MDINMNIDCLSQTSLVFLTFLQQSPCVNNELQREVDYLNHKIKLHGLGLDSDIETDGLLETDGHSINRSLLLDFAPQAEYALPEAQAVSEVAAELVRIADDFNDSIVSQAAERLNKKLRNASKLSWLDYLSEGVDSVLTEVQGGHNDRIVMAVTFSLVKAVCERTPRYLCDLCNVLMRYNFRKSR